MPIPFVQSPLMEKDAERISGPRKGIQGHRNSCYLDATLFAMFSCSAVFDSILLQKWNSLKDGGDEELARSVQLILRNEVVNPLRKELYCTASNVMKLRETMQHLDDKLTSKEMDPQEFLHLLFSKVLNLDEFMSLSSGLSEYFHQILVAQTEEEKNRIPTVQQLFEQSLITQELKLKGVPRPALILQMPRSGNKYKMFDGIFPNLSIDITDLMLNTPRICIVCGSFATRECPRCYGKYRSGGEARDNFSSTPRGSGANSTAFCDACLHITHRLGDRQSHYTHVVPIKYRFDAAKYFSLPDRKIPRVTMNLFAVICIETSHFVSFVKCGAERLAPWIFFDSMADRVENPNGTGHNIPHVKLLPMMGVWLEELEKSPENIKEYMTPDSKMPAELRRLFADPYICLYYSPQSCMYC